MKHERLQPTFRILYECEATRGTSQIGSVTTPYNHLVSLFGEPLLGDCRKTTVQWIVETEAGIGTIYDYSFGDRTTAVEAITDWHVDGRDEAVYETIIHIVEDT